MLVKSFENERLDRKAAVDLLGEAFSLEGNRLLKTTPRLINSMVLVEPMFSIV